MDWSKAKTVLIIALLVTNLFLGGTYLKGERQERQELKAAAESAVTYAKQHGISMNVELPIEEEKLPVLFVSLRRDGEAKPCEYKGISVEAENGFDGEIIPVSEGDASGRLISAAKALVMLIDRMDGSLAQGLEIDDLRVVYMLDDSVLEEMAAEDTAVPAWKFSTSKGEYYVNAFE